MHFKKKHRFRVVRAIDSTLDGIKGLWKKEQAFRQEIYISIILSPFIIMMHIPSWLRLLLILLLLFLLLVEAINSALETVVDRISLEINSQSKLAKDMGSAAVGIAILMNLFVWLYAVQLHFT